MGERATEQEPLTAGELIRFWRTRRRLSQLELALEANVSTKHLSFVETGRSHPSRQLVIHLAQKLDLPIGERNRLLVAGGFAPPYQERPRGGVHAAAPRVASAPARRHESNPALVVDGLWNLIEANAAASLLWEGVDQALLEPPVNILRLGVHPGGLPAISSMTAACSAPLAIGSGVTFATIRTRPLAHCWTRSRPTFRRTRRLASRRSRWSRSTSARGSATCVSSRSSPR